MGFFSRIGRESGEPSDTPDRPSAPAERPARRPESAPGEGAPANGSAKPAGGAGEKAPAQETPPQSTSGASGSWPGSADGGEAKDREPEKADRDEAKDSVEAPTEKRVEVEAKEEPAAEGAPELSSNGTPPDLVPPDAAPVPKRVSQPDSDDDDEPGEVRLRAEDIIAPTPKRPHPFMPHGEAVEGERRARVISFANQKGGVAKTTTTLNLAVALSEQGYKVLCIDLDPQGNLTMSQGVDPESVETSMYNVLVEHVPITEVIAHREIDIAVASIDLAGAEIAMSTQIGRERSLQKALHAVGDEYDFICIDTPPSLGLLTINALTASDRVIVPVQCEYLSMRGLAQLQNTLEMIRENLNPGVEIEGILPTMMDSRTVHAKEAVEILEESFGDLVFKTKIKKAVKFAEAPVRGTSVLKYDPEGKAAGYYRQLAQEVLSGVKA